MVPYRPVIFEASHAHATHKSREVISPRLSNVETLCEFYDSIASGLNLVQMGAKQDILRKQITEESFFYISG